MARAVVVLCDVHLENGERVRAEELPPIAVEGKEPRILALCPRHRREFYDPFVDLVDDLASTPADGTGTAPEPLERDKGRDGADGTQPPAREDPEQVVEESPAMTALPGHPDAARWDCPVDGCDKSYSASGENRAEDLKRLGNLHLSTAHDLDKAARLELLSA